MNVIEVSFEQNVPGLARVYSLRLKKAEEKISFFKTIRKKGVRKKVVIIEKNLPLTRCYLLISGHFYSKAQI